MMFYLAADSEDAYAGLTKRFPNNIVMTKAIAPRRAATFAIAGVCMISRPCVSPVVFPTTPHTRPPLPAPPNPSPCSAMIYSLAMMMNLAQTRLILGSGYSSYSEVAAQMGGIKGRSLPMLMAGKDFGRILSKGNTKVTQRQQRESLPEHRIV